MLNEKDAVQKEKDALFTELRHRFSLCTCPSYISITELKLMIEILKGEKE